jgi:predicted short-subunit dehydrogenase-like oxidoreductase (DUF2520 family)
VTGTPIGGWIRYSMQETIAIVGGGRLGRALAGALHAAGPYGRGFDGANADVVLLCVPDAEIAAAAAAIDPGPLVGHCSGATGLGVLAPHEAFGLHPLMTVTEAGADFASAGCAVAGSTARALGAARRLARVLGMRAVEVADGDRAAYHAAAAIASNFLVTLESAAEALAATAGVQRELFVPLVRATVENWAHAGDAALTGPIARGDEATVARHREAIFERAPELMELYDVLAAATRQLAASTWDRAASTGDLASPARDLAAPTRDLAAATRDLAAATSDLAARTRQPTSAAHR